MRAWTGAGESADPPVSTPNAVPRLRPATAVQKEAREIPLPSPVPRAVNNLVASRAAVRSFVMQWKTIYISSMIDGA